MEGTCHIGWAELARIQEASEQQVLQSLEAALPTPAERGLDGTLLPYRMSADWPITTVVVLCFLLLAYALRNGKKYILQRIRHLFVHKQRVSLFDVPASSDSRYSVALVAITCILAGLCLFDYYVEHGGPLMQVVPHSLLLAVYSSLMLLFILFKEGLYSFVNWIFFENSQQKCWMRTYFDTWASLSLVLFPLVLMAVYVDLPASIMEQLCIGIWCFVKILLFYKCVRNFFGHFYGVLHLILYFCALEIIPTFLLWEGIGVVNSLLTLKF